MKSVLATACCRLLRSTPSPRPASVPQAQAVRPARRASAAPRRAAAPDAAFLKQYCVDLSQRAGEGRRPRARRGSTRDSVDGHAEVWEKVVRKLRTGMMPPDGAPKPPPAARDAFTAALEAVARSRGRAPSRSRRAGAASAEPHRIRQRHSRSAGARRRRQCAAAAGRFGRRLRQHRRRARRLAGADRRLRRRGGEDQPPARSAIRRSASIASTYRMPGDLSQDAHVDGLPLGTRGGMVVRHTFPLDAEYDLQIGQAGGGAPRRRRRRPAAQRRSLRDARRRARRRCRAAAPRACRCRPGRTRSRPRSVVAQPRGRRRRCLPRRDAHARHHAGHHRRPVQCHRPGRHAEPPPAARLHAGVAGRRSAVRAQILSTLADARLSPAGRRRRAPEIDTLLEFYRDGRAGGRSSSGIQRAVARVLVDPQFLFRFEREPASVAAGARLPPQRSRAGVAAVVLPVEQRSRRRAARRRRARAG